MARGVEAEESLFGGNPELGFSGDAVQAFAGRIRLLRGRAGSRVQAVERQRPTIEKYAGVRGMSPNLGSGLSRFPRLAADPAGVGLTECRDGGVRRAGHGRVAGDFERS